ncbi:MAG: HAD family hydrolase [Bryobacteraceae bacterium]
MPPVQPKAIIFDYGNVLCAPQPCQDVEAMATVLQVSPEQLETVYWPYRLPYDDGRLDAISYWRTVAHDLGRPLAENDIQRLIQLDVTSWTHLDARMMEWARRVRAGGVRTAILSNMPLELRNWIVHESGWLADFDFATFSCDLGIAKPDAAIYQHCLSGLGVAASETLFFDDRQPNVDGARLLGIHAVHFTTPQETLTALDGLYRLPVLPPC